MVAKSRQVSPTQPSRALVVMARFFWAWLIWIGFAVTSAVADTPAAEIAAEPLKKEPLKIVTVPLEKSARQHLYYFPELLKLALSKTEATEGPFVIEPYPRVLTGARFLADLANGEGIDIIWTMTNPELERTLLRIPVSLLRGLNSHRVFLIREEDQEKFAAVQSLDDLKGFRAGMVSHWPDTEILRSNGLRVVTSAHYELLFTMLEANRIDYFPRGLYEVWQEQEIHEKQGLAVEKSLMLYYYGPMFFFVNRQDQALADRIERGLRMAMADGSFDKLFFSIPGFQRGFDEISNEQRRLFKLPLHQEPVAR